MKHYQIIHKGLIYCVDVYASSKRDAIEQYRRQWQLTDNIHEIISNSFSAEVWEALQC